jgi:HlyD family secretion protein
MFMAITTLPRRGGLKLDVRLMVGIGLVIIAIAVAVAIANRQPPATAATSTTIVKRGNIVGSVAGSGSVTAEQSLDLSFQTNGTVVQVLVKEGDAVTPGQVLAKLDDRALQAQVANAQASLDSAKARLVQTQMGNGRPEEITAAQAAVASAQAAYDAAVQSAATSNNNLVAAQATMLKAKAGVDRAQAAYDRIGGASNPMIGMTQQALDLQGATLDYQNTRSQYESLLKTSATDAKSKVASAHSNWEQAKSNLAKLTTPATETDLAIQQAAVTQAEQSLKQAQLNLENATLEAPFVGVVSIVSIIPGSTVNGSTIAAKLINRNPLHVNLKLSENDVVQIQLDQPVTLTIDSLKDWKAEGKVSYIALASEISNGVVTYAVRVIFNDSDPRVKVGMTANLDIITAQKDNLLLVPNSALLPKGSGHVVQVIGKDGKASEVDVQTGLTDGTQTEIISGLSEGMPIVALPGSNAPRPGGFFP